MKDFFLSHKKILITIASVILLISFAFAFYFSYLIKNPIQENPANDPGVFGNKVVIHDSTEGEIIIGTSEKESPESDITAISRLVASPEKIWTEDTYAGNHTPVEKAQMADGSIGVLNIDKLNLSVNVFESEDTMEDMSKGVAHFPSSSAYDGNVCVSAHNINFDGSDGYFKDLYTLSEGDIVSYKTALGERNYVVKSVTTIAASDWTPLGYTDYNQLTMITCISGQPEKRLCVQALEQ